jgi:hypothetical protein
MNLSTLNRAFTPHFSAIKKEGPKQAEAKKASDDKARFQVSPSLPGMKEIIKAIAKGDLAIGETFSLEGYQRQQSIKVIDRNTIELANFTGDYDFMGRGDMSATIRINLETGNYTGHTRAANGIKLAELLREVFTN